MIKIIGIGDLVADLYYKDGELVGINGGKTTSNIIANLSHLGHKTAMIGTCGNDIYGFIARDSLTRLGVDISQVIIKDISTKKFHNLVDSGSSTGRCPVCNNKPSYKISNINIEQIKEYVDKEDIIVIDNISKSNEEDIAKLSITNAVMIDIGYYNSLKEQSNDEIIRLLSNKFTIINMNERVEKYLLKLLNIDDIELFNFLNPELLIITRGKRGSSFIYDGKLISKELVNKGVEVNASGAGDAFFASVISAYINNNLKVDDQMIDVCFDSATKITREVVSKIGARSHIDSLYKAKKINGICTCKDVSL